MARRKRGPEHKSTLLGTGRRATLLGNGSETHPDQRETAPASKIPTMLGVGDHKIYKDKPRRGDTMVGIGNHSSEIAKQSRRQTRELIQEDRSSEAVVAMPASEPIDEAKLHEQEPVTSFESADESDAPAQLPMESFMTGRRAAIIAAAGLAIATVSYVVSEPRKTKKPTVSAVATPSVSPLQAIISSEKTSQAKITPALTTSVSVNPPVSAPIPQPAPAPMTAKIKKPVVAPPVSNPPAPLTQKRSSKKERGF